jgi:hypothetical protein
MPLKMPHRAGAKTWIGNLVARVYSDGWRVRYSGLSCAWSDLPPNRRRPPLMKLSINVDKRYKVMRH